ncbi:hypothetical protein FOZ61_006290 [Perkinsus olseni]|uniref:Uncharacterized protein n=1 Tax=Perkinsus olseni TaxID=32597 RepID=A0A7J6LL40_PEROL|nr:hypothetical protein FOZ61_006290 [Perkinsus olseni]KAF4659977.1 hypothetical protein FOL46_006360 [Perkinsus olseni]
MLTKRPTYIDLDDCPENFLVWSGTYQYSTARSGRQVLASIRGSIVRLAVYAIKLTILTLAVLSIAWWPYLLASYEANALTISIESFETTAPVDYTSAFLAPTRCMRGSALLKITYGGWEEISVRSLEAVLGFSDTMNAPVYLSFADFRVTSRAENYDRMRRESANGTLIVSFAECTVETRGLRYMKDLDYAVGVENFTLVPFDDDSDIDIFEA